MHHASNRRMMMIIIMTVMMMSIINHLCMLVPTNLAGVFHQPYYPQWHSHPQGPPERRGEKQGDGSGLFREYAGMVCREEGLMRFHTRQPAAYLCLHLPLPLALTTRNAVGFFSCDTAPEIILYGLLIDVAVSAMHTQDVHGGCLALATGPRAARHPAFVGSRRRQQLHVVLAIQRSVPGIQ
jgi:hypothetical protein